MIARLAGCALAALLALSACGEAPLPKPSPRPSNEVVPIVTSQQLDKAVKRVVDGVNAADAEKDAKALAKVADGPALAERTAAYAMLGKNPSLKLLTPLGQSRLQDVVPADQGWPRSVLVVTQVDPKDTLPQLLVLTQATPREEYKLSAYVPMIGGATLPDTAPIRDGVSVRRLGEANSLTMSPRSALNLFAASVATTATPTTVPGADQISKNALSDAITKAQHDDRQVLTVACKDCFEVDFQVAPTGRQWSFNTSDGGALVVGELQQKTTLVSQNGYTTPVSEQVKALSGAGQVTKRSTQTMMIMTGMYLPPATAKKPISVVAGQTMLVAADVS